MELDSRTRTHTHTHACIPDLATLVRKEPKAEDAALLVSTFSEEKTADRDEPSRAYLMKWTRK